MLKCSYCGKEYSEHKGLTLVFNDGNVKHLCSSKCRKNLKMRRRKVRWISKEKKVDKKIEKKEVKEIEKKEVKEEKVEEKK